MSECGQCTKLIAEIARLRKTLKRIADLNTFAECTAAEFARDVLAGASDAAAEGLRKAAERKFITLTSEDPL